MEHTDRFCLSLHAGYRCHHSGACCTAGWTIPIEPVAFARVQRHFGDATSALHFRRGQALPEGAAAIVGVRENGACAFFESDRGRLCAIHRELGADALPSACRQFPRVVVHDPRGMRISLSHFCPSAAALLLSTSSPTIINAPRTVDLDGAVDGLDARDALPPLLHPEMLMDFDGYVAWESRAIEVLGREASTATQAIATIAAATRDLESWCPSDRAQDKPFDRAQDKPGPGAVTLTDAVSRAFERAPSVDADDDRDGDVRRVAWALDSVPSPLRGSVTAHRPSPAAHAAAGRILEEFDHVVRNYLTARLFGNWIAYYGRGLGSIVEYLRVCRAVLEMEVARHCACSPVSPPWQSVVEPAVRSSDRLLVHLSDAKVLARQLSSSRR